MQTTQIGIRTQVVWTCWHNITMENKIKNYMMPAILQGESKLRDQGKNYEEKSRLNFIAMVAQNKE